MFSKSNDNEKWWQHYGDRVWCVHVYLLQLTRVSRNICHQLYHVCHVWWLWNGDSMMMTTFTMCYIPASTALKRPGTHAISGVSQESMCDCYAHSLSQNLRKRPCLESLLHHVLGYWHGCCIAHYTVQKIINVSAFHGRLGDAAGATGLWHVS